MWDIKNKINKTKHVDTEDRVGVTRGEGAKGEGEMGERGHLYGDG